MLDSSWVDLMLGTTSVQNVSRKAKSKKQQQQFRCKMFLGLMEPLKLPIQRNVAMVQTAFKKTARGHCPFHCPLPQGTQWPHRNPDLCICRPYPLGLDFLYLWPLEKRKEDKRPIIISIPNHPHPQIEVGITEGCNDVVDVTLKNAATETEEEQQIKQTNTASESSKCRRRKKRRS